MLKATNSIKTNSATTAENAPASQTPTKNLGKQLDRLKVKGTPTPIKNTSSKTKKSPTVELNQSLALDPAAFAGTDLLETPQLQPEPLLVPNNKRFVLFPIQYHKIWAAYKNAEAKFWSAEEIEFADDADYWNPIPAKQKACLLHALAIMSVNDLLAGSEPILSRLSDEIQAPEARCYFGFQLMQKNIHTESLNVLLDLFSKSATDKIYLFESLEKMPTTSRRVAWIQKYLTESPLPYSTRLFALATYCMLFNTAVQTILLLLCNPSAGRKSTAAIATPNRKQVQRKQQLATDFHGLQKCLVKIQADQHRAVQFLRLLACEHFANPIDAGEAAAMVRDAIVIEGEIARECFEMGGAGLGEKGTIEIHGGSALTVEDVCGRAERIGDALLKTFGVVSVFADKKLRKSDGLQWMDEMLWELVEIDSGVVEHVVVREEKQQVQQEKMNVRQEFSLDEDF
ncbi:Ribonucleoside-diphosphate reductase subunit M2 [Physocladia obscura]|uniref:Ribonucleoside-diphosphate reductase subunit M2 n=1 Tax=Physocladia obscura TaxID=109957 RepID=A0AAD5T1T6_9FUNG|nr:Ribonucleoside-diphosphate reductase subunit M2 [Physocladia obscura]